MKKFSVLLVVLLAGCPPGPTTKRQQASRPPADTGANREYSDAAWQSEVLDSAEPVLVDFWAPWCQPCLMVKPAVEALGKDYKVHQVNIDKNPQLARRYGATTIPLFLIFKEGKEVARHQGASSETAKTLQEELEKLSRK